MAGNPNLIYIMAVQGTGVKPYQITYHRLTGEIACACRSWCVTVPRADCKHIRDDVRPWLVGEQPKRKLTIYAEAHRVRQMIQDAA